MNKKESNINYIDNSNKNLKKFPIISLSRDEEELIYLMKKSNLTDKIEISEFDLFKYNIPLKKINSKRDLNNKKLVDQVDLIYNKIYTDKIPQKSESKKLIHYMIFNESENKENSRFDKSKLFQNKKDIFRNPIRKKLLPKLFSSELSGNKINKNFSKINLLTNNDSNYINENNIIDENNSHSNNNFLDKNKKIYYLINSNKKKKLPPINKRNKFKLQKIKLNVINAVDPTDQKHEEMMRMYKEIEFRNKKRFII